MLLSHRRPCGRTRDGGGGRGHHRAVIVKKRNNNKTTTVIISIHGRRDVRDAAVCKKKREKETGARAWSTDVRVSTTSTNDWRRRSGRAREDHARLLLRSSPEHVWRRRRFRVAATPSLTSGSWWWLFPANRFAPPPRTDTRDVVNRGGGAPLFVSRVFNTSDARFVYCSTCRALLQEFRWIPTSYSSSSLLLENSRLSARGISDYSC